MRPRRPDRAAAIAGIPRELTSPQVEDFIDAEDVQEASAAVLLEHEMGHQTGETLDERLAWRLVFRARGRFGQARADYIEDHGLPESAIPGRGLLPWRGEPPRMPRTEGASSWRRR